jgi:histone H2A
MVKVLLKKQSRPKTLSKQAGLEFPVKKVKRLLERFLDGTKVSMIAAVYMTSTLEYMTAEMMELAGNNCRDIAAAKADPDAESVVGLKHLRAAVAGDDELNRMMNRLSVKHRTHSPSLHTDCAKVS